MRTMTLTFDYGISIFRSIDLVYWTHDKYFGEKIIYRKSKIEVNGLKPKTSWERLPNFDSNLNLPFNRMFKPSFTAFYWLIATIVVDK